MMTSYRHLTCQQWKCRVAQDLPEKLMFSEPHWGEIRNWNALKFETQEVAQKLIYISITSQLCLTLDRNDPMKLMLITAIPHCKNYIP